MTLDRNPGNHQRPSRSRPGKMVRAVGLSKNDRNRPNRTQQWAVRDALHKEFEHLIRQAAVLQGCPSFREGRPQILVRYVFRTRLGNGKVRDWQNYDGAPLYDALVRCGVIRDDNGRDVDILRPEVSAVDKVRPRIEIWLKDTRVEVTP